jgi:hypothetical protein
MRTRSLSAVLLLATLTGCSVISGPDPLPEREFGPINPIVTEEDVPTPNLNQVNRVTVGESMISLVKRQATAKVVIEKPVTARTRYSQSSDAVATLAPGEYKMTAGERNGGNYYSGASQPVVGFSDKPGGQPSPSENTRGGGVYVSRDKTLWVYWFWSSWKLPVMARIELGEVRLVPIPYATGKATFRRELVYSGRAGNTLNILYREFANDMARPAFSQSLQYDIGTDPVIGYQGAKFKILSADNTGISYEVLSHLNAPTN